MNTLTSQIPLVRFQRVALLAFLFAGVHWLTPTLEAQTPQTPPTCDSEQHRQFDFWVGEWRVESPDGTFQWENTITKELAGCVIQENWRGSQGSRGHSFNMYFRRDGKWHQTWVDNSGGRLDVEGGFNGKVMTLEGTMPGRDGSPVQHKIQFTPQEDGTVRQHWQASRDGGKTWADQFLGIYKRK